jgi:hypothetical protein
MVLTEVVVVAPAEVVVDRVAAEAQELRGLPDKVIMVVATLLKTVQGQLALAVVQGQPADPHRLIPVATVA